MGTNLYWNTTEACIRKGEFVDTHEEQSHIGKRSAAGLYCWDCELTLCRGGNDAIHFNTHSWSDCCLECGKTYIDEKVGTPGNPAGLELGFAPPNIQRPTGVRGASSFTWAQDPLFVRETCRIFATKPMIRDEYRRIFLCAEFIEMLRVQCPIEHVRSIGQYFS